jgi:hypothetical protein
LQDKVPLFSPAAHGCACVILPNLPIFILSNQPQGAVYAVAAAMGVVGEPGISAGVDDVLSAKRLAPRIFDGAGVVPIGFGGSGGCLMFPIAWEPFARRWMNFQISGVFHD